MRKKIKKWGRSYVIILNPEDMEFYRLKTDNFVEVELKKVDNTEQRMEADK